MFSLGASGLARTITCLSTGAEDLYIKQDDDTLALHIVALALVDFDQGELFENVVGNEVVQLRGDHGIAVRIHAIAKQEPIPFGRRPGDLFEA